MELRAEAAADVPDQIAGDPLRMRQIIANLVSNAVKFTEHGSVVVRAGRRVLRIRGTSRFAVAVEDSGTGIPADKLLSIFEKFTQADGSVTPQVRRHGTGPGHHAEAGGAASTATSKWRANWAVVPHSRSL